MGETKRCPYCGEEILAVAKKCRFCGEWLDGRDNAPAMPSRNEPVAARQEPTPTAPTPVQPAAPKLTPAEKLEAAARAYADSHMEKCKRVYLLDEVDDEVLSNHKYARIAPGEKVIMVVGKATVLGGGTGLVFTNRYLYYRLSKNFTGMMFNTGSIPMSEIATIEFGATRESLSSYYGTDFLVDGKNLGRMYVITGVNLLDKQMLGELNLIFDTFNQ